MCFYLQVLLHIFCLHKNKHLNVEEQYFSLAKDKSSNKVQLKKKTLGNDGVLYRCTDGAQMVYCTGQISSVNWCFKE